MNGFWEWFKDFFEDHTSGASIMRLVIMMWMITFCSIILYVDIRAKEIKPIDGSYVTITGLLAAAKVGQRMWGEKEVPPSPGTPPPAA